MKSDQQSNKNKGFRIIVYYPVSIEHLSIHHTKRFMQGLKTRGHAMAYSKTIVVLWVFVLLSAGCQHLQAADRFTDSTRFTYGTKIDYQAFTDKRVIPPEASPPTNVRPEQVSFEMTLVPGDAQSGIKLFYLSTTEVTAEMFYPWATGIGLGETEWMKWAKLNLRPSRMLMEELRYGPPNRPALGMSRTVAEHYCQWLSQQTGRRYRLPTDSEWEHALKLGGGMPEEKQKLLEEAVLEENCVLMLEPPFLEQPAQVGKMKANALGLYDMLGNAAEWVTDTGKARVVRGGHFMLKADDLNADWRAVEDVDDWNSSSPWGPKPAHWYTSFPYTGIRLACDADQAPKSHPDVPQSPESPAP